MKLEMKDDLPFALFYEIEDDFWKYTKALAFSLQRDQNLYDMCYASIREHLYEQKMD